MFKNLLNRLRSSKGDAPVDASGDSLHADLATLDAGDVEDLVGSGGMRLEPMMPSEALPERQAERDSPRPRKQETAKRAAKEREEGDYAVLAHPEMVDETAKRKILLVGHCAWATLDPANAVPDNMVLQPERSPRGQLQALLGKRVRGMRVALDARLFEKARTRYALAIDAYLAWGLSSSTDTTILLGGVESEGATYLDVLVFQKKVLVSISDRELPAHSEPRFSHSLRVLLDELRGQHPAAHIVAAAPLPNWSHDAIQYLGAKPLRSLRFAPISARSSSSASYRTAAVFAGAGMFVFSGLLGYGWHQYSAARTAYQVEAADPLLAAAGGVNNAKLELQQQQRAFMEARRPQALLAERGRRVVHGVAAVPGIQIVNIAFGASAAGEVEGQFGPAVVPETPSVQPLNSGFAPAAPADVVMVITVPIGPMPAMEQAKATMAQISATTGLALRLTAGGWNDDVGLNTRKLTIEGTFQ